MKLVLILSTVLMVFIPMAYGGLARVTSIQDVMRNLNEQVRHLNDNDRWCEENKQKLRTCEENLNQCQANSGQNQDSGYVDLLDAHVK